MATDQRRDLALLRSSYEPEAVASFRPAKAVSPSERVVVVGYPLHGKVAIKPILVTGHVVEDTRVPRPGRYPMKIDVRRGNSGGPVVDRAGRVVGVVVAKINTPHVYAVTGRLERNIGIAIQLAVVFRFLRDNDVTIRKSSTGPSLTQSELFSKAHQFVGQVGCWR